MPTYTIGSSYDDGWTDNSGGHTGVVTTIGNVSSNIAVTWLSFRNIPTQAISSATLVLTTEFGGPGYTLTVIGAAISSIPPNPTTYPSQTLTSNSISVNPGTLVDNQTFSVDIYNVINEIMSSGYWVNGGCITLYVLGGINGNANGNFNYFWGFGDNQPQLIINDPSPPPPSASQGIITPCLEDRMFSDMSAPGLNPFSNQGRGLACALPMWERTGQLVKDLSGNGQTGQIYGIGTWGLVDGPNAENSGALGNYYYNPDSTSFIGLPGGLATDFNGTNFTKGYSISMWFRGYANTLYPSQQTQLAQSADDKWYLFWTDNTGYVTGNPIYITFYYYYGNTLEQLIASIPNTSFYGQWFNVCVTYDPHDVVKIYVNGVFMGSSISSTTIKGSGAIWIGGNSDSGFNSYYGPLKDFRIYNRPLSQGEVVDIYQNPDELYQQARLFPYMSLDIETGMGNIQTPPAESFATGSSAAVKASVGNANATSSATGVSAQIVASVGNANGHSSADGMSNYGVASSVGNANGSSTANAVLGSSIGVGHADGSSIASGYSNSKAVGKAHGSSRAIGLPPFKGIANGRSTANAVSVMAAKSVGNADGSSTATAQGIAFYETIRADGSSTATAVGHSLFLAVGNAPGVAVTAFYGDYKVADYIYTPKGGLVISGSSDPPIVIIPHVIVAGSGGLIISGASTCFPVDSATGNGGLILSGTSTTSYVPNYVPEGGLILSGTSIEYVTRTVVDNGGSLILSGVASTSPTFAFTNVGGSLIISTSLVDPVVCYPTYGNVIKFDWNIQHQYELDLEFNWNVGNEILQWYQIEGKCLNPTGANTGLNLNDPNPASCSILIQTIAAYNLSDLCAKYKLQYGNNPINWQITRIRKFTNPVFVSDAPNGVMPLINDLVDQYYCNIPECFAFCLTDDLLDEFTCQTLLQDKFYTTQSNGGLSFFGVSSYSSSAGVVPNGGLTFSGSASVACNHFSYVPSGSLNLENGASVVSSRWNYTPGQGLQFTGSSDVVSQHYSWSASGGLSLTGVSPTVVDLTWTSPYALLLLGGTNNLQSATLNTGSNEVAGGNLIINGTASVSSNHFVINSNSGSLTISGQSSEVSPAWTWNSTGGLQFNGQINVDRTFGSFGGLSFAGISSYVPVPTYVPNGGLTIGGTNVINNHYNYTPVGEIVLSGIAGSNFVNLGQLLDSFSGSVYETDLAPADIVNADSLLPVDPPDTGTVTAGCNCDPMPLTLYLKNNLSNVAVLSGFLKKNGFTIPSDVILTYYSATDSWRKVFQWTDKNESWIVNLEWGCASVIGGVITDSPIWKLSILFKRTVFSTGNKFDSRILYTIPTSNACDNSMVNLSMSINVNTTNIVLPVGMTVRDQIIYDDIGIFNAPYWIKNTLLIQISEKANNNQANELDVSSSLSGN